MYVFKNSKSTFSGWTIPEDCIEITEADYQKLMNDELEWRDGVLVPHTKTIQEITEENNKKLRATYKKELNDILRWLADNDWKVNKVILGEWPTSDARWVEYVSERNKKRKRHEELQALIEGL